MARWANICAAPKCHERGPRCVDNYCAECCNILHQRKIDGSPKDASPHPVPLKAGVFDPYPAKLLDQAKVA